MKRRICDEIILLKFQYADESLSRLSPAIAWEDTMDKEKIIRRIPYLFYKTDFNVKIKDWKYSGTLILSDISSHKTAAIGKILNHKTIGKTNNKLADKENQVISHYLNKPINQIYA